MKASFWENRRVFITGHTGFKGSWLSLWLQSMGADVAGFALAPPSDPSLFEAARVAQGMASTIGDIRNLDALQAAMKNHRPEIVIHMAAQSLVRPSYADPVETYSTNVMGTVNVLEAMRRTDSVKAAVVVTSDKCYENREWVWGYRENEPMGGHDPYSSSKGCAELVTSAYRSSFFEKSGIALASARAGNVIGGGDWAADRLVPDILRAFEKGMPVVIRNPGAIRPWQHVLEPLSGYLLLARKLVEEGAAFAEGWNFGPEEADAKPVSWIAASMAAAWGASWVPDNSAHPHEAHRLKLDCSKARSLLGWLPKWGLETALHEIVLWHQAYLAQADMREFSLNQIAAFQDQA